MNARVRLAQRAVGITALAFMSLPRLVDARPLHGLAHQPIVCAQGSAFADGCLGASLGASFQNATFFTTGPALGQVYQASVAMPSVAHPPPWNVAGVDYPVGAITPMAALIDPFDGVHSPPAGCANNIAGHSITCSGSGTLIFSGYRLDDPTHTVGPLAVKQGIRLFLYGTYTSATISNNYFYLGPGSNPGQGDLLHLGNNYPVTITNNTWEGNSNAGGCSNGTAPGRGCSGLAYDIGDFRTGGSNYTAIEYNYFVHTDAKTASIRGDRFYYDYNYIGEYDHPDFAHDEIIILSNFSPYTYVEINYNTFLSPVEYNNYGGAAFFTGYGSGSTLTVSTSPTQTSPTDGGPIVAGMFLPSAQGGFAICPFGTNGTTGTGDVGTYALGTTTSCTTLANASSFGSSGSPISIKASSGGMAAAFFVTSGSDGDYYTELHVSHNTLITNSAASSRLIEPRTGDTYMLLDISYNYMDPTGVDDCYFTISPGNTAYNNATFTGNIDMIDGSAVNGYANGTTIASCKGSGLNR